MKVSELRAILATLPDDMEVLATHADSGWPQALLSHEITTKRGYLQDSGEPFLLLSTFTP